jgi:hypothetical protein
MQPDQEKTYLDKSLYSAKPSFVDPKTRVGFTFGITRGPIVLPASATSRDKAHVADLRPIDFVEATRLLVERLTTKVAYAARDAYASRILYHELHGWRGITGGLLGDAVVQAALAFALDRLTAAQVPPAPPPVDRVSALTAQVSALTARLAALEGTDR